MKPPEAAAIAWLVLVRKGHGIRGLADALIEAFDSGDRAGWQKLVDEKRSVASWGPFVAAARERFDLT